jgi:hypothetical protein
VPGQALGSALPGTAQSEPPLSVELSLQPYGGWAATVRGGRCWL